jgi:2-amino-4-hydroxy-6-hydroxymethyldihydropteridine diphosphokinase
VAPPQGPGLSRAFLALGANIGEPAAQLAEAIERIGKLAETRVVASSSVIVTPAWGVTDQPDFLNQVIAVETGLDPETLLAACLRIEAEMGRVREQRWGPRLIDIDIIAYGRQVMATERLILPHPNAHERDFVLVPLRQIAPDVAEWIVGLAGR